MWLVVSKEIKTNLIYEAFTPVSHSKTAETIERGINRNLNKELYYTDIIYLGKTY